jgi:hypothetical protein
MDTGQLRVSFHFQPGGAFIYRNPISDTPSSWTQQGGCVRFDDGSFLYEGRVNGTEMEGTSRLKDDPKSRPDPWRAQLQGPPPASWGAVPMIRRAFAPGAPESLVRTGRADYNRVEEGDIQGFSVATGPGGKVTGAGADRRKKVSKLYDVSLFVDETGARQAFGRWKAKDLAKHLGKPEIHEAVLAGSFDRLLLLRFSRARSAREMRQDFAESLGARIGLSEPGVDEFMKCIGRDFVAGSEIVLRSRAGTLGVEVAGAPCADLSNPALSRAVLGIWVGKDTLSGRPDGLLAAAGTLMKP